MGREYKIFDRYGTYLGSAREAEGWGGIIVLGIALAVGAVVLVIWLVTEWVRLAVRYPLVVLPVTAAAAVVIHLSGVLYPPTAAQLAQRATERAAEERRKADATFRRSENLSDAIVVRQPASFGYDNYYDGRDSGGLSVIYFDLPVTNNDSQEHSVKFLFQMRADIAEGEEAPGRPTSKDLAWSETLSISPGVNSIPMQFYQNEYSYSWYSNARNFKADIATIDGVTPRAPRSILDNIDVRVSTGSPPLREAQFSMKSLQDSELMCHVDITNDDSVAHSVGLSVKYRYAYSYRGKTYEEIDVKTLDNDSGFEIAPRSTISVGAVMYPYGDPREPIPLRIGAAVDDVTSAESVETTVRLMDEGAADAPSELLTRAFETSGCRYRGA